MLANAIGCKANGTESKHADSRQQDMCRTPYGLISRGLRQAARGFCRFYPLLSGCTQISNHRLLHRMTRFDELKDIRLKDGSMMRVQLNDYGGRSMYFFGDYDPKVTVLLRRLLRPGDHLIDIGANFGLISLMAAKLVGATGSVHAFEPQVALAGYLSDSARLNRYGQLVVHPVGLSDGDREMAMFVQPGITGAASLVRSELPSQTQSLVRVVDAGAYLAKLGVPRLRMVKIDVEGHEYAVLSSARVFLEGNIPETILFESQEADVPFHDRPTVQLLTQLDYEFYPIGKSLFRLRLQRECELPSNVRDRAHDILAVHRSAHGKL